MAERRQLDAEEAERRAETRRVAEAEQAEKQRAIDAAAAEERRKRDITKTAERERKRIEDEERLRAEEARAAELNESRRVEVRSQIMADLQAAGLNYGAASLAAEAIINNKVRRITVDFVGINVANSG